MTSTTVTLTGTGVPHPSPGRARPGVLVRHGATALRIGAGRATVVPPAEAIGIPHLVLTHLIPPPADQSAGQTSSTTSAAGGDTGRLAVGRDLLTEIGASVDQHVSERSAIVHQRWLSTWRAVR